MKYVFLGLGFVFVVAGPIVLDGAECSECPWHDVHDARLHGGDDPRHCRRCAWNATFLKDYNCGKIGYGDDGEYYHLEVVRDPKTGEVIRDTKTGKEVMKPGVVYDVFKERDDVLAKLGPVMSKEELAATAEAVAAKPAATVTREVGKLVRLDPADGMITDEELDSFLSAHLRLQDALRYTTSWREARALIEEALRTFYPGWSVETDYEDLSIAEKNRHEWFEHFDLFMSNPLRPALDVGYAGTPHAIGHYAVFFRVLTTPEKKERISWCHMAVYKDQPRKKVAVKFRKY